MKGTALTAGGGSWRLAAREQVPGPRDARIVPIALKTQGEAVLLPVKVVPGASRSRVMGEWNGRLKVAVAAPPEKGQANAALVDMLADLLDLRHQQVSVVEGLTSPQKVVRIAGLAPEEIRRRLGVG